MTRHIRHNWYIHLAIIALTVAIYWQATEFDFVHYDDGIYVTRNDNVLAGLTTSGVKYAFTSTADSNRIPLVWLSFMLDREITADPDRDLSRTCHRTNLILHAANGMLLFLVLNLMTGSRWRSAVVAALFIAHPLRVESVAWVAERKDVLSTFFMMLTLLAYLRYVRKPGMWRYVLMALAFALGLMSKSMLVTLPVLLLLLDFWPLRRLAGSTGDKAAPGRTTKQLLIEKTPLLMMSLLAGVATIAAQQEMALGSIPEYPIGVRIANAFVSCGAYLAKMVFPTNLSCIYMHPMRSTPVWMVIGSGILVTAITTLAVIGRRKLPWLTVGWLWYLISLLPVIGLVQVGLQGMADRYTYVPFVGVFVALVWGVGGFAWRGAMRAVVLPATAAGTILLLSVMAYRQVGVWRDSLTLFGHAIEVEDNRIARDNYGLAYYNRGTTRLEGQQDIAGAIDDLRQAVRYAPGEGTFHLNLSRAYQAGGLTAEATSELQIALKLLGKAIKTADNPETRSNYALAYYNRGLIRLEEQDITGAISDFRQAVRYRPREGRFHYNLSRAYMAGGLVDDATRALQAAVRAEPSVAQFRNQLGILYGQQGKIDLARSQFLAAVRLDKTCADAYSNLGKIAQDAGDIGQALRYAEQAYNLAPNNPLFSQRLEELKAASRKQR